MRRSRLAPLAAGMAAASLIVAGTASAQSPAASGAGGAAPLKIGVVTDVGHLEDRSFNQFSNQGAIDAATQLGGTHDVIVTEEIADYANNIQTFVDQDYDVIVTIGFLIGSDTLAAAKANPDVHFIGVDQNICVDADGNNDTTFACPGDAASLIPNYQGILFKEAQPGYLVGIVAATISQSGTIGAVGGTNVPAVVAYRDGYINGAKSVNPDIEVLYQEANPDPSIGFYNPELGGEIGSQMLDLGADVIFQIAGATGIGALEAACAAGAYGIGVDVDQSQSLAESNPGAAECIVTSAEKKLQDTVKNVILSVADGSFKAGPVAYDATSTPPAIGYSPFQETYADLLTPELQGKLDAAFQGFVDGTLDPAPAASTAP